MKKFVRLKEGMALHTSGGFYKVATVDNKIAKLTEELTMNRVYSETLEDNIKDLDRIVAATTQVIDDLQHQLKINKAMRKDARVYS